MSTCIYFAAVVSYLFSQLSVSPDNMKLMATLYLNQYARIPEAELKPAIEKDHIGFATLQSWRNFDKKFPATVALGLSYTLSRRIDAQIDRWTNEKRIDFLVEAAISVADFDPSLTEKLGLRAIGLARSVAKNHVPKLIELPQDSKWPLCYPFEFESLKAKIRLQTKLDLAEAPNKHGAMWVGPMIGCADHLKSNDEFRLSLLLLRDGCALKVSKGARTLLTFDQMIVLSNGPVALDGLKTSLIIADGSVHFTELCDLLQPVCIVSNQSIHSQGSLGASNSAFYARNAIRAVLPSSTKGSTLIAGEEIDLVKGKTGEFGTHIVGKDKFDPGVRFFAVADVGLELKDVDGKVVVKSVAEDSPFRKSLKPGDRINSINDKFFKDFDDCRRVLREACVVGYAFVNRTRDGGHARVLVDLLGYPKPLKAK